MAAKPFPILFIGPSRIADAVLASGLIRKLADEAPGARFTLVVGPDAAPLFTEVPGLDALIVQETGKGWGQAFGLWSRLRHTRWSLIVDMVGTPAARLLRAERRSAPPRALSEPVHRVIEAAALLTLEGDPPAPFLFTNDEIEARAVELLGEGGPLLALAPASDWLGKTWPIERFARAAIELLADEGPMAGGRLLVLGGQEDMRYVEPLVRTLPRDRVIDLTGQLDPLTSLAVLKQARLFIGNDTALMHLAAAAGAPTLGLIGPSDDRLYAPWGPRARVVRGPREFEQFKAVDPGLNQTIGHMMDLPVDTVVEAAKALLEETA